MVCTWKRVSDPQSYIMYVCMYVLEIMDVSTSEYIDHERVIKPLHYITQNHTNKHTCIDTLRGQYTFIFLLFTMSKSTRYTFCVWLNQNYRRFILLFLQEVLPQRKKMNAHKQKYQKALKVSQTHIIGPASHTTNHESTIKLL